MVASPEIQLLLGSVLAARDIERSHRRVHSDDLEVSASQATGNRSGPAADVEHLASAQRARDPFIAIEVVPGPSSWS
jgi:hypothetical protein